MRVDEAVEADAHLTDLLALYYLDALDRRSADRVGRHLEGCADCRAEAGAVCETLAALGLLFGSGEELLNAYGALGAAAPPAFPERFAPQQIPEPDSLVRRMAEASESGRFRLRRRSRASEDGAGTGDTDRSAPEHSSGAVRPDRDSISGAVRRKKDGNATEVSREKVGPPTAPPAAKLPQRKPAAIAPSPALRQAKAAPTPTEIRPLKSVRPIEAPATVEPPGAVPTFRSAPPPPSAPPSRSAPPRPAPAPARPAPAVRPPEKPVERQAGPAHRQIPANTAVDRSAAIATPNSHGSPSRPPTRRPGVTTSRRTGAVAALSALVLAALAVAGVSAKSLLAGAETKPSAGAAQSASTSATDRRTGVALSVSVTANGQGVTTTATIAGLHEGAGYRLFGYTFDGRQRPVANWTGRKGSQQITGELPVEIADISHFVVTRDAKTVVTAYLSKGPAGR
ncbi:zf-HC2 domain-containing protein [Actinoplanes sp. NBRC 103695]|uniref:zf-HC2 domain-containing protein n=1 Tax=Actinoplanes sp. NBRC 103695 TaxID=3032202 RepID=UPI0024A275CD|nr:zf-HC2 domain-containing protein [Actinoplanes sp. NBRC 103695]GLY97272.1 hypothetical protein Acsp02_45260 [Actinoplanes sp. NBRC 103695]